MNLSITVLHETTSWAASYSSLIFGILVKGYKKGLSEKCILDQENEVARFILPLVRLLRRVPPPWYQNTIFYNIHRPLVTVRVHYHMNKREREMMMMMMMMMMMIMIMILKDIGHD